MTSQPSESKEFILSVVRDVSKIVSEMSGIQLGDRQFPMVENRLRSRMVRLELAQFSDYLDYLREHKESESQNLLSLMTTHHTYFFREFSHFEFLLNKGLARLVQAARDRGDKVIRIWSAASSRGQEAYSLAMFFNFHLTAMAPDVTFEIWGTDVDPESVAHATNGVYKADELKQSPAMYVQGNWIRGKGDVQDFTKAKDSIKSKCRFATANLLKIGPFLSGKTFDVIFCRNVFIYFNKDQIKQCTQEFIQHLSPAGFLFLGVSESISGMGLKIEAVGPSVHQLPQPKSNSFSRPTVLATPTPAAINRPIEVLCVDDSKAILALLGKILTKENGFVVTGTANNGREAVDLIKQKKFDFITLDLHMPELDGVGFLQETQSSSRPPVLVISSINRDDTSIGQKALSLGAADYVEKPSLENLSQAGNEIRSKIKTILSMQSMPKVNSPSASTAAGKKKVLIVDDSKTIRDLLKKVISSDPDLEVIAEAAHPDDVEGLILKHKPDVLTLDIHMPGMDGITLLKKIHPKFKIPTVMISSISREEGPQVLQALEAGAIDYIQKPQMQDLAEVAQVIREKIKAAASAKIRIRTVTAARKIVTADRPFDKQSLILIGASTGGTEALKDLLTGLPSKIPPILIVQHIPPVFSAAFANRLNDLCPFEVTEAVDGEELKENHVYIAPGGTQMGIKNLKDKTIIRVGNEAPVNRHKPSVDYLFKSIADTKHKKVTAVILTGMGADGARMMKLLRDQGARTIAQNQESCIVFGMPKEAIRMGGAEFVLSLEQIPAKIMELCSEKKNLKVG